MPTYTPPLRDMQFVMHEVLNVTDDLKACTNHADIDADTINAVLEEAGKFAAEVAFPLNISGDEEGCTLDKRPTRSPHPRVSRKPMRSTFKPAGLRSVATRNSAARACRWW
jgi:hypothetical protein